MAARIVEHRAPTGDGRENAQAEKTQSGFGKYGSRHPNGRLNQDWLKNIWQQMPNDNAWVWRSKRTGGKNKFKFLHFQNLSPRETRITCPTCNDKRENHFTYARTEKHGESDGQQNTRERKKRVDEQQIDDAIEPAAEITSQCAH